MAIQPVPVRPASAGNGLASASPTSNGPVSGGLTRRVILALLLLIVVTSLGRLVGLADLLVWHDEVFTLVRVFGYPEALWQGLFSGQLLSPAEVLRFQQPDPTLGWDATLSALAGHPEHAPLYYALAWSASALPLDPVTAMRGTAAIFGMLLPLAVFWLMRELFGRGAAPWVAAALIACSPLHLLYAQEARQYALWTLMVVIASALLVRALRGRGRGRGRRWLDWTLYGVSITLGLWSHLLFVLLLPVHAAYGWLVAAKASGRCCYPPGCFPPGLAWRPWLITVGIASLLFMPWILVIIVGHESAASYTEWMQRAIGAERNLTAWGHHFVRAFLDLTPVATPPALALWLLLPLAVPLLALLFHAPRPARWLLPMIALVYLGVVLGPDLLLGGSRSLHVRYGLPAVLAVQLMVAWGIARGLECVGPWRALAAASLVVLLAFGLLSQWRIHSADTWWSKQFSADNATVAALINNGDRPLVAVSEGGVATGELLSLAYHLDPAVRIVGFPASAPVTMPDGFGDLLLLLPDRALREAAETGRDLRPVPGTWQWFLARP